MGQGQTVDYEADMHIDETALDVEWLLQAELAIKYGQFYTEHVRMCRRAEERKKIVRSELIRKVAEDPMGCCGKAKPTSGDVEAYYRTHPTYKEAVDAFIEVEYEKNMAEIAKNEIMFTRKAALEHLVTLHGQQYFAGPRVPRNLTKEVQAKAANAVAVDTVRRTSKTTRRKRKE